MHAKYLRGRLSKPKAPTYDLSIVIPGSAENYKEKKRENGNEVSRSEKPSVKLLHMFIFSGKN